MKLVFWGTPSFSVFCLDALHKSEHKVLAVVTQPDREQGRHKNIVPSPVKEYAMANSIPVLQPANANDKAFIARIAQLEPDVMVLVAYGQILKKALLTIPKYGFLNVHFSLLPKYRGSSPIAAAMLAGETETGVSIIRLVPRMDAGPICGFQTLPLKKEDTREDVENALGKLACPLILEVLQKAEKGTIEEKVQDESMATYCPILKKEDGQICWSKSAQYLERFVRAMSPWPEAYCFYRRKSNSSETERMIIKEAVDVPIASCSASASPGTLVQVSNDGIYVATGDGCLQIKSLQKAGKRTMKASEFLAGNPMKAGDILL